MTQGSHMSNFHGVTQYGSKIRHATVTGVTCDTAHCQLWHWGRFWLSWDIWLRWRLWHLEIWFEIHTTVRIGAGSDHLEKFLLLEFNSSFPTFTSLLTFIQFILYYFLSIKLLSDISVYVHSICFSLSTHIWDWGSSIFHSLPFLSVLLIYQMYLACKLG